MGSVDSTKVVDALIIGGGVSGLAAALTLARQQHTAVVLDSQVYRNAPSGHMHNVLTWDREDPATFRAAAKKNIEDGYTTITFETTEIASIVNEPNAPQQRFTATSTSGAVWVGRKVILATGVRDIYPDIDGYGDCFGKGIYHCFFCKGYEARGSEHAAILALPDLSSVPAALHAARTAARFTKSITIYTHGSDELQEGLIAAQGSNQIFKLDNRKIARFEKGPGFADVLVHFEDGEVVSEAFIGHKPPTTASGKLHDQLGLEMTAAGDPVIKPMFCETSVKGVFACGDSASPIKIIPQSLFSGSAAAAAVCAQIQAEDASQSCIF
ncbi:hypothetical protein PFICI_09666 [Pestalotiopsis fici W106-1]|uniref:FAD/NAD(P)-binding domain-containing protein n=1 Tax=Pestalotiopsis fici (strain W106-1 / CGMCC3.15140) TaxID=1229662 RepID=W3WUW5_PESFW|nr:uncharacterized protein PFICI_09666 [Pestalotiopsis fici W106-1]ETS77604.1 hypothetical protein PFICI_09666 [Pestalotiopsis fici W106-1]